MNKPYFCRNFFLTNWHHKRLKNTIDLLLFYEEHFYGFSESEMFCSREYRESSWRSGNWFIRHLNYSYSLTPHCYGCGGNSSGKFFSNNLPAGFDVTCKHEDLHGVTEVRKLLMSLSILANIIQSRFLL